MVDLDDAGIGFKQQKMNFTLRKWPEDLTIFTGDKNQIASAQCYKSGYGHNYGRKFPRPNVVIT